MCRSMSLFTGLSFVWFFFAETRSHTISTKITRNYSDSFTTNVFCGSCSNYGASGKSEGFCACDTLPCAEPSGGAQVKYGSVFLRSQGRCSSSCDLRHANNCFRWEHLEHLVVIDTDNLSSTHKFKKSSVTQSCRWSQDIAYLNATGHWELVNLSANAFQVLDDALPGYLQKIKVNQQSAVLAELSGHIIKLGLNCTTPDNETSRQCLIFKSEGELNFTLCNHTVMPTPSVTRVITGTPSITVTPSSISTELPSNSPVTPTPNGKDDIVVAFVAIELFLCLILGTSLVYFCYFIREYWNQEPREVNNFTVIQNPGPQAHKVQEEPLYVELPDIPTDMRTAGSATDTTKEKSPAEDAVILNPYVSGALFTRGRSFLSEPLPVRPIDEEYAEGEEVTGHVHLNEGRKQERQDVSVILRNPQLLESAPRLSPGSRSDHDYLPKAREGDDEVKSGLHHQNSPETDDGNENKLDYQGLVERTRAQGLFVCPCCNKSPDYQRLCTPNHCQCESNEELGQKRQSIYESLSLEQGTRESFYATPSRAGVESTEENEDRGNVEQSPEYHILEPNEMDSNQERDQQVSQEPVEPVNHEYNELEEPDQICCESDEDNNKLCEGHRTDGGSEITRDPLEILHKDIDPAYAMPWEKKGTEVPTRKRSRSA